MNVEVEIVKWYLVNKRELPWRNTTNPYEIWISEVILQQTRVAQALEYYKAFLQEFPNIASLAKANPERVLKLWQGLGYYSRARNLHFSAKYIVSELKGIFPDSYAGLKKLKGVGGYTAAAIASFAYGESVPVVDGNVYRVLARLFAEASPINSSKGKKIFFELASELIKSQKPDVFNQAIMEFGALQCVPKNPDCRICPLIQVCLAYIKSSVSKYPVKAKPENKKNRYFNYFFIDNQEYTFIKKRDTQDIWQGLYEFPLIESSEFIDFTKISKSNAWNNLFGNIQITLHEVSKNIIHKLTHQNIYTVFFRIGTTAISDKKIVKNGYLKIRKADLEDFPVPKLIENYIKVHSKSSD